MSPCATIAPALVALAKAGDPRAVNEVLRLAAPALRRVVWRALRRRPSILAQEETLSYAMERAWCAIPSWDPSRGSLAGFVAPSIRRHARKATAGRGRAVAIPDYRGGLGDGRYAADRANATATSYSMDQANVGGGEPLRDTLPARAASPETLHDVARILSALSPAERTILLDVAAGVTFPEIGAEMGVTKQYAHKLHGDAMAHARKVARRGLFK